MQDLHSRARQLNRKQWRGFTIVEVLIVVVVIAILAAVTVVAYNGITASAKESALRSDLSTDLTWTIWGSFGVLGLCLRWSWVVWVWVLGN